ncbi:hypothetical protein ELG72_33195 (plasmid) [Rhizobium leguminosarum]|nr:hypothetical protein ELG92_34495 [Rhizobium leguminosarum]TBF43474.1 hypothetical protein ELG91_35220 [Rhizobium leguminosarum]TBF46229.1 hypothetical protein ELG87_33650 [Rhizobium leguminosarum]TBF47646.1 hypothetical protein ELG90_31205 [Rhizobium leguminosarum]TBF65121.1 hypothetical protein ELG84_34175 [Rhizobium leguminosarum]
MSKNDIPPRITGWWLTETCRPQRAPSEEVSVSCRPRRSCRLRRRLSSWACRSWLRRLCSKHRQQWALPFASQP